MNVFLEILKKYLEQLFCGVDILGDSFMDKKTISKLFFLIEFIRRNVEQDYFFHELAKLCQSDSQSDSVANLTLVFLFKASRAILPLWKISKLRKIRLVPGYMTSFCLINPLYKVEK